MRPIADFETVLYRLWLFLQWRLNRHWLRIAQKRIFFLWLRSSLHTAVLRGQDGLKRPGIEVQQRM